MGAGRKMKKPREPNGWQTAAGRPSPALDPLALGCWFRQSIPHRRSEKDLIHSTSKAVVSGTKEVQRKLGNLPCSFKHQSLWRRHQHFINRL